MLSMDATHLKQAASQEQCFGESRKDSRSRKSETIANTYRKQNRDRLKEEKHGKAPNKTCHSTSVHINETHHPNPATLKPPALPMAQPFSHSPEIPRTS